MLTSVVATQPRFLPCLSVLALASGIALSTPTAVSAGQLTTTAVRAGVLIDPEAGTATSDQVILVEGGQITAVGGDITVPAGAQVIDLSDLTVLPGLVDAHNHLGLTYKDDPERNIYYLTYPQKELV